MSSRITVGRWHYVDAARKIRAEVTVKTGRLIKDNVQGTVLLIIDPISGKFITWGDWLSAELVDLVLTGVITAKEISAVVEESANRWDDENGIWNAEFDVDG